MFGIASRYVKVRRKAPAFHAFHNCLFSNMQAKSLLLALTKRDASPNKKTTLNGDLPANERGVCYEVVYFLILFAILELSNRSWDLSRLSKTI